MSGPNARKLTFWIKGPVRRCRSVYYERLALETRLSLAGFKVVKPPTLSGISGVSHRCSLLVSKGSGFYGFDIYPETGEIEVIRTYIKMLDTGARMFIASLKGKPNNRARGLASVYGIPIVGPGDIDSLLLEIPALQSSDKE